MCLFITQGNVILELETSLDLSSAANPKILYKTPGGKKGEWTATVSGTKLTYQFGNTTALYVGDWQVQTFVTISGLQSYGQITTINFAKPLNL